MKNIIGTYNPYYDQPGFVVTIFSDSENSSYYIQEYDEGKLLGYCEILINPVSINRKFVVISNKSNDTQVIYSFFSEEVGTLLGNLNDITNKLESIVDDFKDSSLQLEIHEFLDNQAHVMHYQHLEDCKEKNEPALQLENMNKNNPTIDELKEESKPEKLTLDDFSIS
ncbi:hypothetical protein QQ008_08960 [Fulvivirgaceae bacterium BMA10]|uniref:Uncharacterized protein n=1 Tax=Splendidivirga corallicola TaxID=3051826 RepID=A0ABT8KL95_9BACT|nr:hypothetical protein [Fulvivirgaceae bacterium BMA10]